MSNLNHKPRRALKTHGIIAYAPNRLPGIVSSAFTGALFMAALLLSFSQAHAGEQGGVRNYSARHVPLSSTLLDVWAWRRG
jgi:hypothetical protein